MDLRINVISNSPLKYIAGIIVLIILAEGFIMLTIDWFKEQINLPETILDPLLLIILISPGIYIMIFKPLKSSFKKKESAINRLEKSEKQLTEAVETKDRLFTIIAHDLRSPFTPLLGIIEYLKENILKLSGHEVKEEINLLEQISKSLYQLVQDLLQWAQLQTNRIEYRPKIFELNNCISSLCELYKKNAQQKNIELSFINRGEKNVYADEEMIKTVLRNLISNAIKFTKYGGTINIEISEDKSYYKVIVKDNGVGMDKSITSKIFTQINIKSTPGTNNEMGTGLGLTLCKELVQKNGGEIEVESTLGVGSSFMFTVPKGNKSEERELLNTSDMP